MVVAEHQHMVERWPAAPRPIRPRQRPFKLGPEQLEIDHRIYGDVDISGQPYTAGYELIRNSSNQSIGIYCVRYMRILLISAGSRGSALAVCLRLTDVLQKGRVRLAIEPGCGSPAPANAN